MKMPKHAAKVMGVIRWWSETDPSGPTATQIKVCFLHDSDATAGLEWLKQNGHLSWENEGSRTRYRAARIRTRGSR